MKTIYLTVVILICFSGAIMKAQTPNWAWAKCAIDPSTDQANSVTTDVFGNVYITGNFGGNIIFGSTTLSCSSYTDIFLVKYDANGNVIWAKSAGGASNDVATSVTTDISGNIYITGSFNSLTISFGNTTLTNTNGFSDIFIAKYDSSGNVIWAKSAGGSAADIANCITTDILNNVYIAGVFKSDTITFGTTFLLNTTADTNDIFFAKYDSSGNLLWAKSAGGTNNDYVTSIATDAFGNTYMIGNFLSPTITFESYTITNAGSSNIFLTKYDSAGNVVWVKSGVGTTSGLSNSVTINANQNIYVAGQFGGSITFGSTTLISAGLEDIFLTKYDTSGNVVWAKGFGSPAWEAANSVITDGAGNIYLAGAFDSTITFGTTTLAVDSIGKNIFLVKLDNSGNVLWAKSAGGNFALGCDDRPTSVISDSLGNVFVTGYFTGATINFGSIVLPNDNSTFQNLFLAKIDGTTGINEISQFNNSILLSPNPFTTTSTLTLQGTYHNPSLFIYNLLGQVVGTLHATALPNQQITIRRNNLPAGMYFYKLIDENKEVLGVGKFIINDF
jgi:hypothetical protein